MSVNVLLLVLECTLLLQTYFISHMHVKQRDSFYTVVNYVFFPLEKSNFVLNLYACSEMVVLVIIAV